MFNKILLICLLLSHLQITVFAMDTEEKPTEPQLRLFPYNKVTTKINDKYLVQIDITQKPKLEKVKVCSFLCIFRTLFKPTKKIAVDNIVCSQPIEETRPRDVQPMVADIIVCSQYIEQTVLSDEPKEYSHISLFDEEKIETDENPSLFVISERPPSRKVRSSDDDFTSPKQKCIEFIPISNVSFYQNMEDDFDDEFSYKSPDITDESMTSIANDLINGHLSSCQIGALGKFILSDEHGPFTEKLDWDTRWFIKKDD